jgi:hypothetical protein
VVTGDFNINTVLSKKERSGGHADIVRVWSRSSAS